MENEPLICPKCGADLKKRGAVRIWIEYPDVMAAHLQDGEGSGVVALVDVLREPVELRLECSMCDEALDMVVQEICLAFGWEFVEE